MAYQLSEEQRKRILTICDEVCGTHAAVLETIDYLAPAIALQARERALQEARNAELPEHNMGSLDYEAGWRNGVRDFEAGIRALKGSKERK